MAVSSSKLHTGPLKTCSLKPNALSWRDPDPDAGAFSRRALDLRRSAEALRPLAHGLPELLPVAGAGVELPDEVSYGGEQLFGGGVAEDAGHGGVGDGELPSAVLWKMLSTAFSRMAR